MAFAVAPTLAWADEARTFSYTLGDHLIDYPTDAADVLDSEMDGFGGQSFIKLKASISTEVALTFRHPGQTLHYIEHDWIDRSKSAITALGLPDIAEFQFGQTKVRDVQKALGSGGFHYACRQILPNAGGFLTFLSFEIPSRPNAVYTFVFEHSHDLAKLDMVGTTRDDLDAAVLVATAIFRPSYADEFWCAERVPYDPNAELPPPPEQQSFADFLPSGGVPVDSEPWAVMTEPALMISKNGAVTWGDRIHIMPDPSDCTQAEIMVWAHTLEDRDLLALEGKVVDASLNLLVLNGVHAPIEQPVTLSRALYAPIEGREWPPFAIGSFVFGPFDFQRIIEAENDPSVFGFSLEFGSDVAGMRDNFWSLEGLQESGIEATRLCEASEP
jgi:hypothetical protein